MTGYRYSPFSKSLAEFPPEELNLLRDVSEGWFVDYKSEAVSPRDFGKHLSAFANQFGGWLFVGVKEGPNKNLKAGSFPGIPSADVGPTMVKIREGVSAHVSPPFYFDHRVIDGPVDAIGLEAGRAIIVVGVPEGPNPPYVHSSGRIYRRIADSSEPKAETDRAVLDAMWRKSDNLRARLREFVLNPTDNSRVTNTVCHVCLMEDPTFSRSEYPLELQGFRDAMRVERAGGLSMPLDNFYPTQDGFIGRQVRDNDPTLDLNVLRWWRTGNVRLTIPINDVHIRQYQPHRDRLLNTLVEAMGQNRKAYGRILNLDQWAFVIAALALHYVNLRDKLQSNDPIWGKIVFSNARSAVPFLGMESYLRSVRQNGIPVVQDSITMFPGTDPTTFIALSDGREEHTLRRALNLIMPLLVNGLRSLGVVFDLEKIEDFGLEFGHAVDRGVGNKSAGNTPGATGTKS